MIPSEYNREHSAAETRRRGETDFASLSASPRLRGDLKSAQGFTLIEIVIAAGLMSLILVSAYLCLNAGIQGKKVVEPRVEILQNARVAMALLTADLRAACPLTKDYDFVGMHRMLGEMPADNLDFATHNYTPRHDHESDFCEESIYLDKDPLTGRFSLLRR